MSELDDLQNAALLLIMLIGGALAFIVWRVCVWVKALAGATADLAAVVHKDMQARDRAARDAAGKADVR